MRSERQLCIYFVSFLRLVISARRYRAFTFDSTSNIVGIDSVPGWVGHKHRPFAISVYFDLAFGSVLPLD
jgi:hypothetical protein